MPRHTRVGVALLACMLPLASCADVEEDISADGVSMIDQRTDALTSAGIKWLNGTYTGCAGRTNLSWSLAVSGTAPFDNDELTIRKGDSFSSCKLHITSVRMTDSSLVSYNSGTLAVGSSYGTARSFGNPVAFYANSMVNVSDWNSSFVLTFLFSSNPSTDNSVTKATGYASVTATTVTASGVAAPNYGLDLSSITVTADSNDAATVTGNLILTGGTTAADAYRVVVGSVADTYAAIDTAYNDSGTPMATIAGTTLLANATILTSGAVRTLIFVRTVDGVKSYQKFTITFAAPI